jgi:hypothetical protein
LGKATPFFPCSYSGIGKEESVVGRLAQDFMGKKIARLSIATGIEAIVDKVEIRIDAVKTVGKEEFHSSSIPA